MTLSSVRIAGLLGRPAPTPEQQRVIEAELAPVLVVAGAGSGKTETMAARVVWLLANGLVTPGAVLGLTFTRKASAELDARIRLRVRELVRAAASAGEVLPGRDGLRAAGGLADLERPTVATYHSYAASLVADHALRLGVEPGSRLLGEAAQFQLVSRLVETWPDDLDTDAATSTLVDAVLALSGALDEHLLDPPAAIDRLQTLIDAMTPTAGRPTVALRAVLGSLAVRRRLLGVVAAYRAARRERGVLDFGDQVALAARIARELPEVVVGERTRFAVVLLDEYQDTSYAQVELLAALFGDGHPVTAVGDPHQSIYGWRGASAGGLARFPRRFPRADGSPAAVSSLSVSWRNAPAVLAVANVTAAPLRAASPVEVPELAVRPGEVGEGRVLVEVLETVVDEAEVVAETIAAERSRRAAAGLTTTAAVLCRRRSAFGPLAAALRRAGLPVQVVGLGGLLDSPEVVDVVTALQVAHDPTRGDAAVRLLTGPRVRLGAPDLHALAAWADELTRRASGPGAGPSAGSPGTGTDRVARPDPGEVAGLVDAIDDPPPVGWRSRRGHVLSDVGRARVGELAGLLRAVRALAHLDLPELVAAVERLLGVDIEVAALPGAEPGRARARLDAFSDVAAAYSAGAEQADLGGFLAWLEAADAREDGLELPVVEPDPQAVQVCTVHAAKGLEWDVVAVPGLTDGVFPTPAAGRADGPTDKGWLTALAALPYPLRGDRDDLPVLPTTGLDTWQELGRRVTAFGHTQGEHQVDEERRLAYVALTRAKEVLLLTAARWDTAKHPRQLSPFLLELLGAGLVDAGLVEVGRWVEEPTGQNPSAASPRTAVWPGDPFDPDPTSVRSGPVGRRAAVQAAADAVRAQLAAGPVPVDPVDPDDVLVGRLLAEDAARRSPVRTAALPAHLSASSMVALRADPARFALDLRRPVPAEPSESARRGTAFHAWVEAYYGRSTLVDLDALPGADDDSVPVDVDAAAMRREFLRTPWAGRRPIALEQDVELDLDGVAVRARIDAVFADDESDDPDAVVVVDWKTGAPPRDEAGRAARETQLAVYRLAWARHAGLAPEQVGTAFCYVAQGRTVRPKRLLDAAGLAALLRADAAT